MFQSIEYLRNIKINNNKKILILGNMNEMGPDANQIHFNLLKQLDETTFKFVILCGEFFETSIQKFLNPRNEFIYIKNKSKIMQFLNKHVHNNDFILIKCSNATEVNQFALELLKKGSLI